MLDRLIRRGLTPEGEDAQSGRPEAVARPAGLSRAIVDLAVYRALTLYALFNLATTLRNLPGRVGVYPLPAFGYVGAGLLIATILWCLWDCRGPIQAWRGACAYVGVTLVLMVLHVLLLPTFQGTVYPPLLHVMNAGICAAAAACGVRKGTWVVTAYSLGFFILRTHTLGPVQGLMEASLLAVTGLAATAIVYFSYRAVDDVTRASGQLVAAQEEQAWEAARVYERARWDALVHDKILGALRLAATGRSAADDSAAGTMAAQALQALRGTPPAADRGAGQSKEPPVSPISAALEAHARTLGLTPDILLAESAVDPSVREAVQGAAEEAIANVARHSGQQAVTIRGRVAGDGVHVVVSDPGRGFSMEAPAGAGTTTGISGEPATLRERQVGGTGTATMRRRMASVGGSAEIDSAPGRGCTVTLHRPATYGGTHPESTAAHSDPRPTASASTGASYHGIPREPPPIRWTLRTFAPMIAIGSASMTLNLFMSVFSDVDVHYLWISWAAVGVIILLSSSLVTVRRRSRIWPFLVAGVVLVPAVLTANTADVHSTDWQYWYVGALTAAVAAIGFRWGLGPGIGAALAMLAGIVLVEALAGRASLTPVTGPFPVLIGIAVVGGMLCRGLDSAAAAIMRATRERAAVRRRYAADQVRDAEISHRRSSLEDSVVPMLERLSRGAALDPATREQCRLLEAAARDQLVAQPLVDADVARAVGAARRRGVVVVLDADSQRGEIQASTAWLDLLRAGLVAVLPLVPDRWRVRASWYGAGGPDAVPGSLVVVGLVDEALVTAVRSRLPSRGGSGGWRITADEGSLLVELAPSEARSHAA